MDSVAATSPHDEKVEKEGQRGHGEHDESPFR
jgi:hypothetical protein